MTSSQRTTDYYAVLKVDRTATDKDIQRAFRKRSIETHPDRSGGSTETFQLVNEANDVLADPQKRRSYDQHGSDWRKHYEVKRERDANKGHITATVPDIEPSKLVRDTVVTVCTDRKTVCQPCNGRGAAVCTTKPCTKCKGQGRITVMINRMIPSMQMCSDCSGDGTITVRSGATCPVCSARGYVTEKYTCDLTVYAGTPNGYQYMIAHAGDEYEPDCRGHIIVRIHHKKTDNLSITNAGDIIEVHDVNLLEAMGLKTVQLVSPLTDPDNNHNVDMRFNDRQLPLNPGTSVEIPGAGVRIHHRFTATTVDGPERLDHPVIGKWIVHFRLMAPVRDRVLALSDDDTAALTRIIIQLSAPKLTPLEQPSFRALGAQDYQFVDRTRSSSSSTHTTSDHRQSRPAVVQGQHGIHVNNGIHLNMADMFDGEPSGSNCRTQ